MAVFGKPKLKAALAERARKKEIPQGLWTKCPQCAEYIFNKELKSNLMVCLKCKHHMTLSAKDRIESICDPGSFEELDAGIKSVDILNFIGVTSYGDRLNNYRKQSGLNEAVVCGWGLLDGRRTSLAVMDFGFLGGSMGSVVGEKITRAIERAAATPAPLIVVSASGGARMYEGMFSLMQMAKTSAALNRLSDAGKPFISVLTNPTMAGVMASFASLGDVILAEPKAMIGFAGARVIRETIQQKLPQGFQTSEFLLEHGFIDHIVERRELSGMLKKLLAYLDRDA
jgi:acetyl-CoA carboxylase carboxyl transferase subunit beta